MTMATLAEVARDVGGALHGADASFDSVSTDTRSLGPGQLFFALRGDRYDASDFIADAAERGAAGAVVEQLAEVELSQIEVDDSRLALGALARAWRAHFDIPVIGITGSNGKTTVKELTASIMRAVFAGQGNDAVLSTQGNLNNDIGLPLTLLRLRDFHQAAVVEMGANHPGEISMLADIAQNNIAVITNAARAHLEGFGSLEEVARTKGGILDPLTESGVAVLNRDDRFFNDWVKRIGSASLSSFGTTPEADFHYDNLRVNAAGTGFSFRMLTPQGEIDISLPLAGKHNVLNALAAAAAAMAAGAAAEHVQAGLANSANVPGRLRAFSCSSGAVIYDDSYNANPDSVAAAIAFLEELPGEPWLVLGDMGELGPDAAALHRGMGERARDAGIRKLFCTGEMSRETVSGFGQGAHWFATLDQLSDALLPELKSGRNVLIKGSRFMGLDRLVRQIEEPGSAVNGGGA